MKDIARSMDGIPICFEAHGSGTPALVFVHGWSCARTYWSGQWAGFSDRHRVVSVDLAGHGESGVGRREWTMPAFGADVVAVADMLALGDLILVGHSMGGDVIVDAAPGLGGRVRGLVWVDTYRKLGRPRSREEIEEFTRPFRRDFVAATREFARSMFVPGSDAALVERVVTDMSAAPPNIAVDALVHSISNDGPILDGLRRLNAPLVAINPDYRPTDIDSLKRYGVSTVIMPEVGHFPMMEDPEAFNRVLHQTINGFIWDQGSG
jgi:pimeloyl-ACP methyl ester carboxylesterase